MTLYDPEVHTTEALGAEIAALNHDLPAVRLGGSLGRAVLYGSLYGNPMHEYQLRGNTPLVRNGAALDIDLITPDTGVVVEGVYQPFPVDTLSFMSPLLRFTLSGDRWVVESTHHNFAEVLHESVVEPVEGETAFGIPAVTFPPQTLLALYGHRGKMRDKDELTRGILREACDTLPHAQRIPEKYLQPFQTVAQLNNESRVIKAQDAYRAAVPERVRNSAQPFMGQLKRILPLLDV